MKKEIGFDEKRVPSRLAGEYTNFGWVRARNRIREEFDRKTLGIALSERQDNEYTETIRRKKRFGYNAELVSLESQYIHCITHRKKYGRGAGFLLFLGSLFLLLTIICAVLTFVPKIPVSVAECESNTGIKKTFNDIVVKINGLLFYGDQYYVVDSEVNKDASETGTIVTVPENFTKAYMIDKTGQLVNVSVETVKDKITVVKAEKFLQCKKMYKTEGDESTAYYHYKDKDGKEYDVDMAGLRKALVAIEQGDVKILRCEKAYLDPSKENTAYYRYYVLYDMEKAPLGFLTKVTNLLPDILANGWFVFLVVCFLLTLVFMIWGGCLQKSKRKNYEHKEKNLLAKATKIVAQMKEEDPSLMSKEQRHFYSWQKLMAGAINMSNVAKNDNSGDDGDGEDDFGM